MSYSSTLLMRGFVTHDTDRYVLERPEGFSFEPGQGIVLTIERDPWKGEGRPFTPTCLTEDRVLELTIKRYPNDDNVTMALHGLEPGAPLTLSEAFGAIAYQGLGVFIAAGAGITPFLAILRRLARDGALDEHSLLFSNKTEADLICGRELRHYLGERALFTFTREHSSRNEGRRIDASYLRGHIDNLDQYFYVCGPQVFIDTVKDGLLGLGVDSERLVYEH